MDPKYYYLFIKITIAGSSSKTYTQNVPGAGTYNPQFNLV
jgi:hypothetical protein